ncbi:MAG: transcriptional repressor [Hyphomicrobiaceae bacterium]|nr:transcriptional repressor [Hyphomicrobiaceae bacterium]
MTDTATRKHQNSDAHRTTRLLRQVGLRPTRQRLTLGALLFEGEDRHVTAELLHAEAAAIGHHVSLATVYNTLHQFKRAGLLRELGIHVEGVPEPPEGTEISHIDVVVRVVTKDRSSPL